MNLYKNTSYELGENVWNKSPYSASSNEIISNGGYSISKKFIHLDGVTAFSTPLSELLGLATGAEIKHIDMSINAPEGFDISFGGQVLIEDCLSISFRSLHNLDLVVTFDASTKSYDFAANPTQITILYVF